MKHLSHKISVIGAGFVGSTLAYTLSIQGLAGKIVLVDINKDRAEGEAMDIEHASPFSPRTDILPGSYGDTANSDIIVITAGTNQKPGETRMDLIKRNASIVGSVAKEVVERSPEAVLLVISNPVDVMTRIVKQVTGFPASRVIGSGTNLDSARFRHMLSEKFAIDSHNIHGYVLGEHGDSEFPAWSLVSVSGMNINQASDQFGGIMKDQDYLALNEATKNAAYEIINRKGATYYGIAASASRICRAILRDEKSIIPISVELSGQYGINEVYLSLPTVLGENGVERILSPNLSDEELAKLKQSADLLNQAFYSLSA